MNRETIISTNAQRLDEWQNLDKRALEYHQDRWEYPKESTFAFKAFIAKSLKTSKNVIDLGAGAGASTAYLATQHQNVNFTALDYPENLIVIGQNLATSKSINNLSFERADWYNLNLS
jgi:tRNA G46 methylase TrmB